MIRLFINALAASAGGGLTYIRNAIPHLAAKNHVRTTLAANGSLCKEFSTVPGIECIELNTAVAKRFWFEQWQLPDLIRRSNSNILLSTGNFALRKSPVPQILLSRNSIYCSRDYYGDLLHRGEYRLWIETRARAQLARRSVHWADVSVAPSEAFAEDLRRWTGRPVRALHHGFDEEQFFDDPTPLDVKIENKLDAIPGALRLLFVSHYNYYRNFETLIRALPLIRQAISGRPLRLFLTCKFAAEENTASYNPASAAKLIKELGVDDLIVQLGSVPYRQLHHLYRRCHIYITPAYAETFAHPLVEAMASGLPVIASDISVHREICAEAALYFERFSPEHLAEPVVELTRSPQTKEKLVSAGRSRSKQFSWKGHVDRLVEFAEELCESRSRVR